MQVLQTANKFEGLKGIKPVVHGAGALLRIINLAAQVHKQIVYTSIGENRLKMRRQIFKGMVPRLQVGPYGGNMLQPCAQIRE